uniref:Helicase ATP-binding domain-containing protein n=1 Tax=Psilocybe cubensis TaxID=181762 RepID=A0A8H8CR72_PSICU
MHSRSNPPTEWRTQEGEDSPCTPSRRAGHRPVTPSNKFVRNPQLAYPSPSTPPRHGKIFRNDSLTPRNAPITPQRDIHGESHSSGAQSRVIFSGKIRDILAVNSHPVKQELAFNHLSTPPTTPIVRSSKPALEYTPVKGMYTSNPTPTSWPSPEPSPSSSRVTRSRQKIGDDRSQSLTVLSPGQPDSTASPALSRGKPSIKLEELEFEDSEIFSIPSSIRAPSTTRSLPRASQTFLPELARPTTRSQTRVAAPLPEVAKEAEQPLFVHNDSLFIFKNGQRLRSFQAIDLHFLIDREQGEKVCGTDEVNDIGYVIAYDMGCGKTAISIALIVCRPPPKDFKGAKATLVIVPSKGIMDHWVKEAQKFAPQLVVCFYDSYKANMSTNADIVLCTYTQVQRQYDAFAPDPDASPPKAQKPEKYWPLYKHGWFRVIADEAHQFRNPETKTAKAMWAIRKKHGLCLTGTPAQNSFLDYYPLIRFLEVTYEKLNSQIRYESLIYAKKQKGDPTTSARRLLDEIEGSFFIFRKKDDPTEDGKPLVPLPPRRDQYIYVELTYWERIAYQHVKDLPLSIFAKITHLRQACDHPVLVSEIVNSSIFGEEDDEEYNDRQVA